MLLELALLAPDATSGASVSCRRCGRPLRDGVSVALGEGPVCFPRSHSAPRAGGPVAQLDLLAMPPEPGDWPLTVDGGRLVCGRCGVVLAGVGWTLREALAAVEGHAEACSP